MFEGTPWMSLKHSVGRVERSPRERKNQINVFISFDKTPTGVRQTDIQTRTQAIASTALAQRRPSKNAHKIWRRLDTRFARCVCGQTYRQTDTLIANISQYTATRPRRTE